MSRSSPFFRAGNRPALILALAGILLLAAFARFWQLDSLPPGLYHDEAYNGLDALSLIEGETFPLFYEGWELYAQDAHADRPAAQTRAPLFFEGNYGREPLHVYLMALSIQLFGPTPFALRFVPAAAGVLAVLTTFMAAAALFEGEHAVPLLAAFILAVLYPALTFSRFGLRVMLFVPLETLTVACFWRGVHGAGWKRFAVAGLFLGAGVYTYAAARLLPLLFLLFVPLWFWQDRPARRELGWMVILMAVISIIVAAPLLLFFLHYPYFFIFRSSYVANKGLGVVPGKPWLTWLGNIGRVLRGLFWGGETNLRHNLAGRPYLDPVQGGLFLLGLLKIGRARPGQGLRRSFLFLWLLVMLLPTILSGDAPHFGRMVGAAPVIAILIAVGGQWLWRRGAGRVGRSLATVTFALLLLVSAGLTGWDYFRRYAEHPDLPAAFYQADWELGQYAAALPDATLYLTPTQEEMATLYFALGGQTEQLRSYYGPAGLIPAGRPGLPTVYLIRPDDGSSLAKLVDYFPTGTIAVQDSHFASFVVPADAPRIRADHLVDSSFGGEIGLRGWIAEQRGGELLVTLTWVTEVRMERNYTAYVHLLSPTGELMTQLDRQPAGYPTSDWRPGEIAVDCFAVPLPADLLSGDYALQTGFYHLPTLEPLGKPEKLGVVLIEQ